MVKVAVLYDFSDRGLHCLGLGDLVQRGDLHPVLERAIVRGTMHQLGELPAEPLGIPDPGERLVLINGQPSLIAARVMRDQRPGSS